MKKIRKSSGDESGNGETGRLSFHKSSRYISISGEIDQKLADEFFNTLIGFESLKSRKPLTIYINSEGGDVDDMFKIYDHIKNSPLFITTVVAGCALSAGFIIFLAGDLRKAFPHALFGFHAPTIYYSRDYSEGPVEAAELAFYQKQMFETMVKIVKDNSNMSEKAIRKYFRVLTRIDAKTALKFGLAHQVVNPPKKILPKSWPASPKLQRGEQKILKPRP
ncbi:MAG: ATP-dependent Clp protease proteolytic subunit [Parcubacteria group bacterium]|nr:ATP-dependent Clp protease proteolytic subunit [Parcubacteria group bacterium]